MEQHCYIISYDLCQPDRDYAKLYQALRSFPNWGKITESTWAIVSEYSTTQIRDFLFQNMDSDDRLFVILSGKSAAWTRVLASTEWMKENLIK